jgi:uncharacterized membrane protein YdjX (TVP38/TMEM64 family)
MLTPRERLRQLGPFGMLLFAAATLPFVGGGILLALTSRIEPWLRAGSATDIAIFVGLTAVLTGLALLSTQFLALFGGYVLGFWHGLATTSSSILIGAIVGYVIAQRIAGTAFLAAIESAPRATAIHTALARDPRGAATTTALLRVSPVVPFAMVNVLLAAARVRFLTFLAGTLVGIAPRTVLVTFAGASLSNFDPHAGRDQKLYVVLAVAGTVGLVAYMGFAARKALRQRIGSPGA